MRAIAVAIALGLFLAVSAVAVGWAQPATPPRQEQQPAHGMLGPGMMGTPAPPTQPGPGTK